MFNQRIRRWSSDYLRGSSVALLGLVSVSAFAQATRDIGEICRNCRVELYAECGGFLEGATFDRSGRLWGVDLLTGNLLRVDENRECRVEGNTGGQPNGAKFHRDGRLFVADKLLGILAFDPSDDSVEVIADSYRGERIRGTNDLVFDAEGGLYFTEPYGSSALDPDGRVFYLPPTGPGGQAGRLSVLVGGLAFPNGIALSADGANVYVGEYAKKRILSVPSASSTSEFDVAHVATYTEGGIGPDGIAFDEGGNLYAAIFQGGEVRVIGADRFHYGSIRLPNGSGTFVTNLAFYEDYLYITEASEGRIWRVRVETRGLPFFHQR
jgi:gluconolactonase